MTKLQEVRMARGLSQSQLAERAGISFRMLQNYEQGAKQLDNARLGTILKICIALDCTIKEVIEQDSLFKLLQEYEGIKR